MQGIKKGICYIHKGRDYSSELRKYLNSYLGVDKWCIDNINRLPWVRFQGFLERNKDGFATVPLVLLLPDAVCDEHGWHELEHEGETGMVNRLANYSLKEDLVGIDFIYQAGESI